MIDEQMTVELDGHEPFVQVPLWVVLHPRLSPTAKYLYALLAAHASPDRDTVWPGRARLASILGLRRAQSVDPYVRELAAWGAVTVERRQLGGMRVRNHYRLRWHPPEGHNGPRTLAALRAREEGS